MMENRFQWWWKYNAFGGRATSRDAEIVEVSKPVFLREIGGFHDGKSSSLYLVTGKVRLLDRAKFELPDYPGGIQLAVQERTTIKEGEQENGN